LPRFPHPSERLALKPRGPALPVAPPDEVASCPASCIFGFCRRPSVELPRLASFSASPVEARVAPHLTPSAALPDASPGSPRLLHLPALPAIDLQVALNLRSFSTSVARLWSCPHRLAFRMCLPMHSPGCPGSCIFRLCRRLIFELPRISCPSAPLC